MSSACCTFSQSQVNMIDSEASWVAAAKAGDVSCFEELVRRNQARIFRLALRITGNQEDAEDAMQGAFIKAYQHISQFRGDSLFSTWVTRIAVNEALLQVRSRRPHQLSLDDSPDMIESLVPRDIQPWEPTPEQRYAQTELREIISKAIEKLGSKYRLVFVLRDMEKFSTEETAQLLGLSVSAVKSRLLRARLMLRSALDKYFRKSS